MVAFSSFNDLFPHYVYYMYYFIKNIFIFNTGNEFTTKWAEYLNKEFKNFFYFKSTKGGGGKMILKLFLLMHPSLLETIDNKCYSFLSYFHNNFRSKNNISFDIEDSIPISFELKKNNPFFKKRELPKNVKYNIKNNDYPEIDEDFKKLLLLNEKMNLLNHLRLYNSFLMLFQSVLHNR